MVTDNTKKRSAKIVAYEQELVEEIEKEMETIIQNEPNLENYDLLLSIKSIGSVNAIATIIHINDFESFENAKNMHAMWVLRHSQVHRALQSKANHMFVPWEPEC